MSVTHSLIQRIATAISARVGISSGTYTLTDYQYNYAIGGVPLLSAATDGPGYGAAYRPDVEQVIEQRKEQFDNYKDPGEYSLNQWWLRSQTSFIGGAGVVYQDPDTQGQALNVRFATSLGVDPFSNPDSISLLRQVNTDSLTGVIGSNGFAKLAPAPNLANNSVWIGQGNKIYLRDVSTSGLVAYGDATFTVGSIPTVESLDSFITESGTRYSVVFVSDSSNPSFIYRVNESLFTMSTISMYNAGTLQAPYVALRRARGLPYLGLGPRLYALDPASTGSAALPTAAATIPLDQNIIDIADGPDAIYVAANSDTSGFIYKTTFNSSTGAVNGLTQVAVLPNGEFINNIAAYVATYLVISTAIGIRTALFTGSGIQYNPPLVTQPYLGSTSSGFGEIAFFGNNAYVATKGQPEHGSAFGIMCINLGSVVSDNNTQTSNNAYCTWVYNPTTSNGIQSVVTDQTGRLIYSHGSGSNAQIEVEHATNLLSSGYLDTGRCRYNTLEPKLFKFMSIKTPSPLHGDVNVAVLDEGGGVTNYITYSSALGPGVSDVALFIPAGQQNWLALRFTLHRNATDSTVGGQLDSWQLKALPGTIKQRSISKWFLLFNNEKDKSGQNIINSALDRLELIRQMCQRGDTVVFQDLVNNVSDQVVIDNYEFRMLAPPGPNAENYGGYLRLDMRTVADVIPPTPVVSGGPSD